MNVDDLISGDPYSLPSSEKERLFLPLLKDAYSTNCAKCPGFEGFLNGYGFHIEDASSLSEFPPLPVTIFKKLPLKNCDDHDVVRVLQSSSTTGQTPSRIYLDRQTIHRQTRALASILKSFLGPNRRPLLILDFAESNNPDASEITARGAGIRGFENYATQTVYALMQDSEDPVDWSTLESFCKENTAKEILIFGFTYLIWSIFVDRLRSRNLKLNLSNAVLFHGGGWKKLKELQVSGAEFKMEVAKWLGVAPDHIHEFYGMVEQVGSIFIDCERGYKHAPNFATVIIRDPLTFAPLQSGEEGLIETISLLPTSYPGQALLTEDQGRIAITDGCPCGRCGVAFEFTSRVEKSELRGCGDIFAQQQIIK